MNASKSKSGKVITHALLKSWSPCGEGFQGFCRLFPKGATLPVAVEGLIADNHSDWAEWLFHHARSAGGFEAETAQGFQNTGDRNTGHRNTGDRNTGDWNTGHWNTGHRNTGRWNTGDRNTGDWNTGHWNTGHRNTGDQNTGDRNTGHRNTGHRNTGHWNTGDWNTGFFNTVTPEDILAFNKPCKRADWNSADIPSFLYFSVTESVYESEMSDEEKVANPKFYVAGGYLKKIPYKEAFQEAWRKASESDRKRVMALPNFDAAVFKEISGIDVEEVA